MSGLESRFQIQKENCAKVPKDSYEQRERKECLPFEMTQAQLEEMHRYDPCAQYQVKILGRYLQKFMLPE
jgi:hypothetical protein